MLSPIIEQAIEISAQWHDGTYRKGSWRPDPFPDGEHQFARIPVLTHLTAVGMMLQQMGWDDLTIAAGFLHDVLEDDDRHGRETSREHLATLIGEDVVALVEGVTEQKRDANGRYRRWKERKVDYLRVLEDGSDEQVAISLADKIHNLWTMNASLEGGIDIFSNVGGRKALSAGPSEQLWFFDGVIAVANRRDDPRLCTMRDDLNVELDRFRRLVGIVDR